MIFKNQLDKIIIYNSHKKNQFKSILVALIGFCVGLLVSSIVIHYLPSSSSDLEKAKELGIVSLSVLAGYPKSQETIYYIAGFFITLLVSLSIWTAWIVYSSKKYEPVKKENLSPQSPADLNGVNYSSFLTKTNLLSFLLVITAIFILTYNKNFFYSNWFNHYTFFSEEGQHLSYANDILHGKKLYKDTYAIYGPLMEYPLALLMKFFTPSILISRIYTYSLDFIAFALIYLLSKEIFLKKSAIIINLLIFLSFYAPVFPAPNGSILRISLALFGVVPLARYIKTKKSFYAGLSGIFLSASLFFSHETAICLAISFFFMLIAAKFIQEHGKARIGTKFFSNFTLGFSIIALPVILFLLYEGTFSYYLEASISYPKYVTLGFGGIPFPNLFIEFKNIIKHFSYNGFKNFLFTYAAYWPIILYLGVTLHIIISIILKNFNYKKLIASGILIYGIILFKGALGRSGIDRNYLLLPPAIILSIFYAEKLLIKIYEVYKNRLRNKLGLIALYFTILIFIGEGLLSYAIWPAHWCIEYFFISNINKVYNLNLNAINDMVVLKIPRSGNIRLPRTQAERIKAVVEYVKSNLTGKDCIFVFPNDATYYFLLDRPMPARFGVLHDAATIGLKEEVVKYLKENTPKFVISNMGEWQVDRIPEEIEFPQILKYINNNYHFEKEIYGVNILRK